MGYLNKLVHLAAIDSGGERATRPLPTALPTEAPLTEVENFVDVGTSATLAVGPQDALHTTVPEAFGAQTPESATVPPSRTDLQARPDQSERETPPARSAAPADVLVTAAAARPAPPVARRPTSQAKDAPPIAAPSRKVESARAEVDTHPPSHVRGVPDMERFLGELRAVRHWMEEPADDADDVGETPKGVGPESRAPTPPVVSSGREVSEVIRAAPQLRSTAHPTEERVEISVGTVHVTVEEPHPAPVVHPAPRPTHRPTPARARLSRYYQREW